MAQYRVSLSMTSEHRQKLADKAAALGFQNPKHIGQPSLSAMLEFFTGLPDGEFVRVVSFLPGTSSPSGKNEPQTVHFRDRDAMERFRGYAEALGIIGADSGPNRYSTSGNISKLIRHVAELDHDQFVANFEQLI